MAARAYRRRVCIDGGCGAYTDRGEGPVIVIVASPLTYVSAYQATAGELVRRGFRVVTLDLPAGGGAEASGRVWTFDEYAAWLGAFLERAGLRGATVVGHSNSGAVALLCAARRPDLVGRLVLAGAVGGGRLGALWWVVARHMAEVPLEVWFTIRGGPGLVGVMVRHWRNFWSQAKQACAADLEAAARAVREPALVVWGRWDHTVPLRLGRRLVEWIRGARWYVSREGAHDWIVERPCEFADVVEGWVKESGVGGQVTQRCRDAERAEMKECEDGR